MSPKRRFNFMIEPEMMAALREVDRETGVKPAEFIRRAIAAALERRAKDVGQVAKGKRTRRVR